MLQMQCCSKPTVCFIVINQMANGLSLLFEMLNTKYGENHYVNGVLIATVILDFRMQNEVSFIAAAFRLFAICFSFEPLHAYFSYDRTFLLKIFLEMKRKRLKF